MARNKRSFFLTISMALAVAIGILFAPYSVAAGAIDDLDLLTENYAPFNFEKNGKAQGISVELLVEMLKLVGSAKTLEDIKVQPWSKGYRAAQVKKNTLLFSTTRTKAREDMFKWVGPIFPHKVVLTAKKSRNIQINSTSDLSNYKIGAIRDDVGEQTLLQLGINPRNIYATAPEGENLAKMLAADRIDMWAYGDITALWNLKGLGLSPSDYEEVYKLSESDLYFALHKDTDAAVIARLQKALDDIRASGRLKEIINKYLPNFIISPQNDATDSVDDLVFLTENYAPYNFEINGKVQGSTINLLLKMLNQAGSTTTLKDIKVLPWARGYKLAQEKKNTVLFSTTRSESREKMFKWVGPIIPTKVVIVAKKSRNVHIGSIHDFNNFKIGAVRADIGELLLLQSGIDPRSIYRTNSSKNTAKMLAGDRIDMWAYEETVAFWNLRTLGFDPSEYESVYTLNESYLYFAVQKDTNEKIIKKLQDSLDEVRSDENSK